MAALSCIKLDTDASVPCQFTTISAKQSNRQARFTCYLVCKMSIRGCATLVACKAKSTQHGINTIRRRRHYLRRFTSMASMASITRSLDPRTLKPAVLSTLTFRARFFPLGKRRVFRVLRSPQRRLLLDILGHPWMRLASSLLNHAAPPSRSFVLVFAIYDSSLTFL